MSDAITKEGGLADVTESAFDDATTAAEEFGNSTEAVKEASGENLDALKAGADGLAEAFSAAQAGNEEVISKAKSELETITNLKNMVHNLAE